MAREVSSTSCALCSEPLGPEALAGAGFSRTNEGWLCAACQAERPRFVRAVAFGSYDHLRPAIHLMKFEGVPALAEPLGSLLAQAILRLHPEAPPAMTVIPVPLFRGKRRYNQSTLLARHALRQVRAAVPAWDLTLTPGLLVRERRTESQYLLTHAQRRANVRGAFRVRGNLAGGYVLLVDDVYTTGATLHECTRVLLRAGAASVRVATLARAGRELTARWKPPTVGDPRPPSEPDRVKPMHQM